MCTHIRIHTHTCTHTHIHGSVSLEISNRWGMNQWGSRLHMKSRKQLNHWVSMSWRHCASTLPRVTNAALSVTKLKLSKASRLMTGLWSGNIALHFEHWTLRLGEVKSLGQATELGVWSQDSNPHLHDSKVHTVFPHHHTPDLYLQCHESQKGRFQETWSGPQCQMLQKGQGKKVKLGAAPSTALIQDTTTNQRFAYCGQFQNKRMSHPFVMERRHLQEFLLEEPSWKFHH